MSCPHSNAKGASSAFCSQCAGATAQRIACAYVPEPEPKPIVEKPRRQRRTAEEISAARAVAAKTRWQGVPGERPPDVCPFPTKTPEWISWRAARAAWARHHPEDFKPSPRTQRAPGVRGPRTEADREAAEARSAAARDVVRRKMNAEIERRQAFKKNLTPIDAYELERRREVRDHWEAHQQSVHRQRGLVGVRCPVPK